MKERVGKMVGQIVEAHAMVASARLHSIGAKILRRHAELVGLKPNFTILDTDDQIRLLKQLIVARRNRREALAGASYLRQHARLAWKNFAGSQPSPPRSRPARPRASRAAAA